MRKGFIINFDLCVDCKACSAACILENRWSVSARNIFTFNSSLLPALPVTHLSLACNHCKIPLCLDGCPTGAYSKDSVTSAVIIDSEKCIGCNYCTWNCPYDAPKLNKKEGFIEKCNLCNSRILEGVEPACTSACPTGSLRFGEIPEINQFVLLNWFPEKNISPGVVIEDSNYIEPLKIFPENKTVLRSNKPEEKEKTISGELSLLFFSFLAIISVSFNISILLGGISLSTASNISVLALAGIISVFHLERKTKAWKAILNVKSSPLSREIILFIIYSFLSIIAILTNGSPLLLISVIIGILLLMSIDYVYTFADRSPIIMFHSGQSFLTGLLVGSYLINALFPFIFIASIKFLFNLFCMIRKRQTILLFNIRMIRIALLLIISASMISGAGVHDTAKFIIFISGEFADRILYYIDFNPVNINTEITTHLILSQNEKKRD